jgi:hypothetical protein
VERVDNYHCQYPGNIVVPPVCDNPPHMLYMVTVDEVDADEQEAEIAATMSYKEIEGVYLEDLSPDEIEVYLETQKKQQWVKPKEKKVAFIPEMTAPMVLAKPPPCAPLPPVKSHNLRQDQSLCSEILSSDRGFSDY